MPYSPGILARGPWPLDRVSSRWSGKTYEPSPAQTAEADRVIAGLKDRGSPAYDGIAARLASFRVEDGALALELEEMRWALRLAEDALGALSVLCVVRDHEGRWLAGRRAAWVASWAGLWALGAGGAVDAGEDAALALGRELQEEWSVEPVSIQVEALLATPGDMTMLIGQAWLAPGAEVTRDHEHDAHAWWPSDPNDWPDDAHPQLQRMATLLSTEDPV
ncbi:NUDIX domain-containing protein [Solirubrobacter phytolaccae]|uniref:NUDIX domain-containing protein n=1 Tax=Solirubrobacter phytolaccae TaxID=1404360 RepID=A0A9X3S6E1_9ACTN|nr:NUDIX domain-containing protein [Solirubrobacter phytolaccae]MDA0178998.1 NUDIX domain-containing protein [Solirubrobacter phytolaccae]